LLASLSLSLSPFCSPLYRYISRTVHPLPPCLTHSLTHLFSHIAFSFRFIFWFYSRNKVPSATAEEEEEQVDFQPGAGPEEGTDNRQRVPRACVWLHVYVFLNVK
jgi:hypothetical protein